MIVSSLYDPNQDDVDHIIDFIAKIHSIDHQQFNYFNVRVLTQRLPLLSDCCCASSVRFWDKLSVRLTDWVAWHSLRVCWQSVAEAVILLSHFKNYNKKYCARLSSAFFNHWLIDSESNLMLLKIWNYHCMHDYQKHL